MHRRIATAQLLRRATASLPSSSSLRVLLAATCTPRCGYALHASSLRRQRDSNNDKNNSTDAAAAAAEDREELERERALREQFVQKIQQHTDAAASEHGTPHAASSSATSSPYHPPATSSSSADQQQQQLPPFMRFAPGMQPPQQAMQRLFRIFFFFLAFMLLLSMLPLLSPRSPVYVMQGLPWWQLPIATTAYYMLLRVVYPRSEEERLRLEYATASRANPHLTFDQFINQQHPTMFQGYRTSQAEVVAAVAACLSAARDMRFVQTMRRAAGRATDPKKAVDDIVDALRRDYPQLF